MNKYDPIYDVLSTLYYLSEAIHTVDPLYQNIFVRFDFSLQNFI